MKVFAIGASRNIGYYTALNLLQQNHTVVFFLRNTSVFDADADLKPYIESGSAQLVKGDALSENDLKAAWNEALSSGPIDVVLFSVGGIPGFSFTKGFVVTPGNLCAAALLNTLATFSQSTTPPHPQPRLIVITVLGLTKASHASLPLPIRGLWATMPGPHADKLGMEKLVHHSAGWTPEWNEKGPSEEILLPGWEARLPEKGWLKHAVVVRPALLTDGQERGKYRVGEELKGVYSVSRRDVAHFISNDVLPNWEKYDGKGWSIAY